MNIHPYAELFPLLEGDELLALRDDISANGLRDAIVTYEGKVLDGRNRLRACELANVEPRFEPLPDSTNPLSFVLSKNVSRRHLSTTQRALIATRVAVLRVGRPTEIASIEAISQAEAAKLMHVSRSAVQRAIFVKERAIPEVFAAVKSGQLTLHRAREIAELPRELQADALNPTPTSTRPLDARVEKIIRKQAKPKRAQSKPPVPAAPQVPITPPPFQTFAVRIADSVRDELDYVNQHELSTIAMWSANERAEALRLLTELRGRIDSLIGVITGGAA